MPIEELEIDGVPDWVVVYGDSRLLRDINCLIKKHGGSSEDENSVKSKIKEICSNMHITNKNLEKPLKGEPYKKRCSYESRIFDDIDGCGDLRLVYIKLKSRLYDNLWKVRLVGIFTHKEIKSGIPAKSKYNIGESIDPDCLKLVDYLLRNV